ncbi:amidohydrolase family protein [bacterium]|nr:amidohydrolase family protein [bacterium]MBU1984796.1 amidohydrolase family protein [bacterium]
MKTLICGGAVCLDAGFVNCDVLLSEGKIERIGENLTFDSNVIRVDATGLWVIPGLIDFHVHMDDRIGGVPLADTYHSGSMAAVLSGITTLIGFVTQSPERSLSTCIAEAEQKVNYRSFCDAAFHLTPTHFADSDWDEIGRLVKAGYRTFKFYTTYREAGLYQDYDSLRRILTRLSALGARVLIHAEDQNRLDEIAASLSLLPEAYSHAWLRLPEIERIAIERVIQFGRETGAAVHIVHVSTPEGAERIGNARTDFEITCETAPHYLLFTEEQLRGADGHRYLCTPPLRSPESRAALTKQAASGVFDIFATDHAAFSREDKDRYRASFGKVPSGLAGVGALFPLLYKMLVLKHNVPMHELVQRLSANPAKLAGLFPRKGTIRVGADADLLLLNPNGSPRPVRSSLADCYEPYVNHTTTLDFRYVFLRGEVVVKDNRITKPDRPTGRHIRAVE